jgi:hypothetical protein
MFFSTVSIPAHAAHDVSVIIMGDKVSFSGDDGYGMPFIDSNNRVQVPVRKLAKRLGAAVEYDSSGKIVTITLNDIILKFEINGKAWLNDEIYEIDTPAKIVAGRTYVPARYVFEPFGYTVKWDSMRYEILARPLIQERWTIHPSGSWPMFLNGGLGMVMGNQIMELNEQDFWYDSADIMLYNLAYEDFDGPIPADGITYRDIILEPIVFEYRLFRVTDKGDVLMFSKPFPQLSGLIPAWSFASCTIDLPFWSRENLPPGHYRAQYVFPDEIVYRFADSDDYHSMSVRSSMYWEFCDIWISYS